MKYKRLTTENPEGNIEYMLNMTKCINKEVYLRDLTGEGDISLVDYCKKEYKRLHGTDIDVGVDEFGEYMDDNNLLSLFYWMAVGYAELRLRLTTYEDSGLSPEQVKEIAKAKEEGRLVELPIPVGGEYYRIHSSKTVIGPLPVYSWNALLIAENIGKIDFLTHEAAEKALAIGSSTNE